MSILLVPPSHRWLWHTGAILLTFAFLLALPWLAGGQAPPASHQIKLNGHTFTLPAGFEIELVAGPPLVDRPITADFDEQGRLYVADSSGSNEKVAVQLEKKPHRIVRLEDTDGDGKFDESVVFADRMMFPEGTMWLDGSLYVAAPPSIWRLTDTDGDGVADQRSEWFQGKTLTGCANDLHGPYRGPDGWIYWCKGAFAPQSYLLSSPGAKGGTEEKREWKTRAAHVFRCRPDGSGLEPVMAGGMDNPVDLVFTPGGERLITTTFFQFPAAGKRDGLLHVVHGGIYGKDWDVIYDHKWTGPSVMPVLTHMGPAAPCGLHRYESDAFGPEYRDNIFAAQFNLQKVSRHVLTPHGATFQCQDSDFVLSDNKDFHPTDVLEDADGSLLIIDTGGWYKLCCPTSQLKKEDVLGAIYRVRKKGMPHIADPRGLKLPWGKLRVNQLVELLDEARPAVRQRAITELAQRGRDAVASLIEVLNKPVSGERRRNAVWAATRIGHTLARQVARAALADHDETVRQAALHSISLWRDRQAVSAVSKLLQSSSVHNRRAAAEALGRIGDRSAVPALLAEAGEPGDPFLHHSLTYALIELADVEGTAAGLKSANPLTRRAALVALDQMEGGKLQAESVLNELAAKSAPLKETAWWIASRHPEWGSQLSALLRQRLGAKLPASERDELTQQLARLARSAAIQQLLAEQVSDAAASSEGRRLALRAMAQASLKEAPAAWFTALTRVLSGSDFELAGEAAATARSLRWPQQAPPAIVATLQKVGNNPAAPPKTRLLALAALPSGLTKVEASLFTFLREQLPAEQPVALRSLAAEVLSRARLSSEQLVSLTGTLKTTGPMEMDRLLEAFGHSSDDRVGQALLDALKAPSARAGLRPDSLKTRLVKYGPVIRKQAEELANSLNAAVAKQQARLEELLKKLPAGDVRRGQMVFNSSKAACISCHTIGYLGGKIGPDLTRIGGIRTERDLLESIVFPNASFVRSYEPVFVSTRNGKTYNGILKKDSPEEIQLVLSADQEVRLPREEIEEMQPGRVSVMPSGLDQQLSLTELADLVAFLKACK